MTRYLLDSNVFISSHQTFFAMDICPGFWDWLEAMKNADRIVSINRVFGEITDQEDKLCDWAKARVGWFLPDNDQMAKSLPEVSTWVHSAVVSGSPYDQPAKTKWMGNGADQYLVAYAKGNGLTLVTQEIHSNKPTEVKIPTVCRGLNVPCLNLFKMLRDEGAVMRMCSKPECSSDCH